jgi:hypothetical protein
MSRKHFCRIRGNSPWLVGLASLGLLGPACAVGYDRWQTYPSVGLLEDVTLRIHWFDSTEELREAAREDGRVLRQMGLHGFSVLKRNTETGEYVCDLYVMKMTGEEVDGGRTTTFGHEVLHCFGLGHE